MLKRRMGDPDTWVRALGKEHDTWDQKGTRLEAIASRLEAWLEAFREFSQTVRHSKPSEARVALVVEVNHSCRPKNASSWQRVRRAIHAAEDLGEIP